MLLSFVMFELIYFDIKRLYFMKCREINNKREDGMWGFGTYLMHLYDYLAGRKHKKKARTCDVCGQQFRMIEEMEVHRRKEHPEAHPRKEESPEP